MLNVSVQQNEDSDSVIVHSEIVWVKVLSDGALLLKTQETDINYENGSWLTFSVDNVPDPEPEVVDEPELD
jgi:hypothetical protein